VASSLYDKGREAFLDGTISWTGATIKAALVTSSYTFSNAHQFWSSVSANQVGSSVTLATKTVTSGVADADDLVFSSVSGSACNALVIYKDTGVAGTSPLIAYIDSSTATGLPVTPNGGNINIVFDSGANRIFKL
jgi:hypothetical protein